MKDLNEQNLLNYLNSFRQAKDSELLYKNYIKEYTSDDTTVDDKEYINLIRFYNKLLNLKDDLAYRIEVGPHCTFLIGKLFERYVNDKTFVLTTEQEHPAVKYYLKDNTYIVYTNELQRKDIVKQIIKKYKESGCINFFLIMQGVVCGSAEFIDENFFKCLKTVLEKEKIPHILALDDCQGLYMTNRDYSIFDAILATAHVLVKFGFEMGILYTKLSKRIGYINKEGLKNFTIKLQYVLNHKNEALKFHNLVKDFLLDEIDNNTLKINNNQAKHMLVISTNGVKFNQKYADEMKKFDIIFSELNNKLGLIRLRYQEAIMHNPNEYIIGLKKLKKILHSLKRMKEIAADLTFDNKANINYDFTINGTNTKIEEINKKIYESTFINMKEDIKEYSEEYERYKEQFVYHYIFSHQR